MKLIKFTQTYQLLALLAITKLIDLNFASAKPISILQENQDAYAANSLFEPYKPKISTDNPIPLGNRLTDAALILKRLAKEQAYQDIDRMQSSKSTPVAEPGAGPDSEFFEPHVFPEDYGFYEEDLDNESFVNDHFDSTVSMTDKPLLKNKLNPELGDWVESIFAKEAEPIESSPESFPESFPENEDLHADENDIMETIFDAIEDQQKQNEKIRRNAVNEIINKFNLAEDKAEKYEIFKKSKILPTTNEIASTSINSIEDPEISYAESYIQNRHNNQNRDSLLWLKLEKPEIFKILKGINLARNNFINFLESFKNSLINVKKFNRLLGDSTDEMMAPTRQSYFQINDKNEILTKLLNESVDAIDNNLYNFNNKHSLSDNFNTHSNEDYRL